MSLFDTTNLKIEDPVVSGKGAKTSCLSIDGKPVPGALFPEMEVCFEPTGYNDSEATRVNLVFRPVADVIAQMSALDEWIIKQAASDSVRLFGKARSEEVLRDAYQAIVKTSDKGYTSIRAKINLAGAHAVKVWDSDKKQIDHPETWRGSVFKPKIVLKGLYFMGTGAFGPTLECTDVQLVSACDEECPF